MFRDTHASGISPDSLESMGLMPFNIRSLDDKHTVVESVSDRIDRTRRNLQARFLRRKAEDIVTSTHGLTGEVGYVAVGTILPDADGVLDVGITVVHSKIYERGVGQATLTVKSDVEGVLPLGVHLDLQLSPGRQEGTFNSKGVGNLTFPQMRSGLRALSHHVQLAQAAQRSLGSHTPVGQPHEQ